MKIRISKTELQRKLQDIQNVVDKKSAMQILSHFLLDAEGNEAIIYATDLQLAIREPLNAEIEFPGTICVPARKLLDIVRETEQDITLVSDDGGWVKVISGKSSFRLACLPSEDFPAWPAIVVEEEITLRSKDLLEMIDKTIYSAGEADVRYTLNSILFHIKPDGVINVVGTDGHRLSLIVKNTGHKIQEEMKLIIPKRAALELGRFINGDDNISVRCGKNHILFKIGERDFLVRLIEGNYPNYEQVLPQNEKAIRINREEFLKSLRRVSTISRERNNAVKLDISDNLMVLTSSDPDLGEARDELEIEYGGEEITIGFNARYIMESLSAIEGNYIIFAFRDQLSSSLLMEAGKEDYKCVIMPIRL